MTLWLWILLACVLAFAAKLAGHLVPHEVLERPLVARISPLLPVALLAGLVAVQTVTTDGRLVVDARLAAIGAAVIALLLRAPFLVVLVVGAVTAALLRWAGVG